MFLRAYILQISQVIFYQITKSASLSKDDEDENSDNQGHAIRVYSGDIIELPPFVNLGIQKPLKSN
jgi:hypothetical protein